MIGARSERFIASLSIKSRASAKTASLAAFESEGCIARGGSAVDRVPACVGYVDVHNHLTSPRQRQLIGICHSYTDIFLAGRWVKATAAFDRALRVSAAIRDPLDGTVTPRRA
jgi:hypothetical protein